MLVKYHCLLEKTKKILRVLGGHRGESGNRNIREETRSLYHHPSNESEFNQKKKCVGGRFIVHYHERGWTLLGSVRSNLLLGESDNNGEERIAEGQ